MKNIAVIGYGVIGKKVADAINVQDDMKHIGDYDVFLTRVWMQCH